MPNILSEKYDKKSKMPVADVIFNILNVEFESYGREEN